FGSVNGFFGGFSAGAYATANAFLSSFAENQRDRGIRSHCLSWSSWEDTGMSRGLATKDAAAARGFRSIAPEQGIQSMLVTLHQDHPHWLIGLDPRRRSILRYWDRGPVATQQLSVCFVPQNGVPPSLDGELLNMVDAFGVAAPYQLVALERLPLDEFGEIDGAELVRALGASGAAREFTSPRNELEQQIAAV